MADAAPAPTTTETAPVVPAGTAPAATETKAEPSLISATETKPAETKPEEKSLISKTEEPKVEDKKAEEKKADAPAPFALDKLKLPEGMDKADPILAKFGETIANDKLGPQERAQALIDLHTDVIKKVGEANTEAWKNVKAEWEAEVKADKEIGGDKLQPALQQISKALETSLGIDGAKAFKSALDITGAGSNPAIVRGMAKLAAVLTEGGHVTGGPGKGKLGIAETFFPNSPDMK